MKYACFILTLFMLTAVAAAQSSSLLLEPIETTPAQAVGSDFERVSRGFDPQASRLSPEIARLSFSAVPLPPPRLFAKDDLVTIVIREASEAAFEASLDTEKKTSLGAELTKFPPINLADLLQFTIQGKSTLTNPPGVELTSDRKFEGEGDMTRAEVITGRIQAKVLEVKPNGNLVLEARKYNEVDKETVDMILTGICRPEDVAADNTILSSQMYDFHLTKHHTGELRKATKKGLITQVFEFFFNF